MKDAAPLRTAELVHRSGYSFQQVRDLERLGVLPPAPRAANGYREWSEVHIHALRAYRDLAHALGPVAARRLLAEAHTAPPAEAAAAVGAAHADLARAREETLRALDAVRALRAEGTTPDDDAMTITQLATALGVRPSTLRFWEREGLLTPDRVTSHGARRYTQPAIRAARVVTVLRAAGHGIPRVRELLAALDRFDGAEEAVRLLSVRLDHLGSRMLALLRAGTDVAEVVVRTHGTRRPPAAAHETRPPA
ncbi:MerR family transcriptional regulator [Streptomyces sp. NPDC004959]|uniref:MerR family transcriptional regulator n=1 Tax=unclassified Streptomyces TaxID=2593676 RepID=UPI0004C5E447|nr:MerR family transcriptional regulator [Streptomyces sp. NRRL F-5630]